MTTLRHAMTHHIPARHAMTMLWLLEADLLTAAREHAGDALLSEPTVTTETWAWCRDHGPAREEEAREDGCFCEDAPKSVRVTARWTTEARWVAPA